MEAEATERPDGYVPAHEVPTEKQLRYARKIAERAQILLPWSVQQNRRELSRWIEANSAQLGAADTQARGATSRQVAFAERIARRKRLAVPDECFRSRELMSRWIDSNL